MRITFQESKEVIDAQDAFINNCRSYISDVIALPNNPWIRNEDPVRGWISKGEDRIGKLQSDLIRFLHNGFFQYGRPVYMKAQSLAERMGVSKTQVVNAISSLVERGILIRIHFMFYSTNRTMLLPGLKEFKRFSADFIEKEDRTQGGHVIFCNLPKSLQKSSRIYNILLYFKQLYLNFKVTLYSSVESMKLCFCNHSTSGSPATPLNENQKTPLLQKLKNKIKPSAPNPTGLKPSLLTTLKKKLPKPPTPNEIDLSQKLIAADYDLDKLDTIDRRDVFSLADWMMMINIRKAYTTARNVKNEYMNLEAKKYIYMVCWLLAHQKYSLNVEGTKKMISVWNDLFQRHDIVQRHTRSVPGTESFDEMAVIYTFYQENGIINKMDRAIKRLFDRGVNHKYVSMRKRKITIQDVFLNPANRKIWHFMIHEPDAEWNNFIGRDGIAHVRSDIQPLVNEARKHFEHFFYQGHPELAERYFNNAHVLKEFEAWVTRLSRSLKSYRREVGGKDLVFNRPESESIIFRFFRWYDVNRPIGGLTLGHLTENTTWGHFTIHMQMNEIPDFWKREEQILREREAE